MLTPVAAQAVVPATPLQHLATTETGTSQNGCAKGPGPT